MHAPFADLLTCSMTMLPLSASLHHRAPSRHAAHLLFPCALALPMLVLFHMLAHTLFMSIRPRLTLDGRCGEITPCRRALRVRRNTRKSQSSERKNTQSKPFCRSHVASITSRLTDRRVPLRQREEDVANTIRSGVCKRTMSAAAVLVSLSVMKPP